VKLDLAAMLWMCLDWTFISRSAERANER